MSTHAVIDEKKPLQARVRIVFVEEVDENAPIHPGRFMRFTGEDKMSKRSLFGAPSGDSPC